jgi:cytochrome c oxidase subunit 2
MDAVFKALADPTRRLLLDRLREHNGQTLRELCDRLGMARQSATQHLDVLERANLVTVVRRGRERLHYLNPTPIHEIEERWISGFEKPRLQALGAIKNPAPSDISASGQPVASTASLDTLYAATDQPPPPAGSARMNIKVNGQQYIWKFDYPGPEGVFSYVDMVVPVGMTITLDITAVDVAHSWWIPPLGGKADGIPGYVNHTWFKIPLSALKPGQKTVVYHGQCAELCGRNHANMIASVIGMRYADWKAWYQRKATEIKAARAAAAKQRAALEKSQGQETSQQAPNTAGGANFGGSESQQGR